MKIVEIIPELFASLTMFPCGLFMGYLTYFYHLDHHTLAILKLIKFGPFLAGGIAAVVTSFCHVAIKFKYKRYTYEHFYFMMAGLTLLGCSGATDIFIYPTGYLPLYIGFAGHGVCYISSLTYINIRTGNTKYRAVKLSAPHVLYLLGVGTGATITWLAFEADMPFMEISERIGFSLAISCSIIFIGCLINEILHVSAVYNYKCSTDMDLDCENIFLLNSTLGGISEGNVAKILSGTVYSIGCKILTVMFFYHPFIEQHMIASMNSNDLNVFQVQWFGLIGLLLSIGMLTLLNYKMMYLLSLSLKLLCLMALVMVCSADEVKFREIKFAFWALYTVLGFGYFVPNMNILSYTSLKISEVILSAGYFCEVLVIGIVQYATVINSVGSTEMFNKWHAVGFTSILIVLGFVEIFVIPSDAGLKITNVERAPVTKPPNLNVNRTKVKKPPIIYQAYPSLQHKCVCGKIIELRIIKH